MNARFYAVLALLVCLTAECAEQAITVVNATLISAERPMPLRDAWVRIEDGVIAAVGSGPVEPGDSAILDAGGGYLLPGLIDSHVHLYHATGLKRRYTEDFDALYRDYLRQMPRSFLYFGFTTVVELNADAATNLAFEKAPHHPRLYHCGQGIVLSDGFMALDLGEREVGDAYLGYLIDHHARGYIPPGADPRRHTPDAAVAHVVQSGGQCIKLYYEEALWWPGGAPSFRLPSLDIMRDVVSAAHARNLPVLLHATTPEGQAIAAAAGIDILAHGAWEWPGQPFDDPVPGPAVAEVAARIAASGIALQPTVTTIRNTASLFDPTVLTDPNWRHVVSQSYLRYLRSDGQRQREDFLARFRPAFGDSVTEGDFPALMTAFNRRYERLVAHMERAGANLLFGTDTAVGGFGWAAPPGLAGYREMQAWVRGGIPLDVLFRALTLDNARAFGVDDQLGSIEPGKRADLLILRSDPLSDVRAYDSIAKIILAGVVLDRQSLSATTAGAE